MQFEFFTLLAFAAVAAAAVVPDPQPFTKYDDFNCGGRKTTGGTCNGGCQPFTGQHSFEAGSIGTHCVTVYREANCTGVSGQYQVGPECTNVQTKDEFVLSYRCSVADVAGNCVL